MTSRILLVEDEPDIRKTLKYNFSRESYDVITAGSISEAENLSSNHQVDLIILDLMLPDGSGLDFCRAIKSDKEKKSIPVIILTAKADEVDRVVGFELGADDYVTKPFSVRELVLRAKAVMKRGVNFQQDSNKDLEAYKFGDLELDLDSHQAFIKNQEINFTALEFRLLKHLIDRKGRVQTRDQLLGDVWGYSSSVTTRTVDTHVKRLREKLGEIGNHIQTIRGVGYRFSRSPD